MPIKMLKPRIVVLSVQAAKPLVTERTRGSAWMKIRDRIMRRANGLCECSDCRTRMTLLPAHQVDHIVGLHEGGTDADANLQAMNVACHARKSAAEAANRAGRVST